MYPGWPLGEVRDCSSRECLPQPWPVLSMCPHSSCSAPFSQPIAVSPACCPSFRAHLSPWHSVHTTNSCRFTSGIMAALGLEHAWPRPPRLGLSSLTNIHMILSTTGYSKASLPSLLFYTSCSSCCCFHLWGSVLISFVVVTSNLQTSVA